MTGGSLGHSEIAANPVEALRRRLPRGGPCRAYRGDVKVATREGSRIRYPDAVVTCSPRDRTADTAPEPVVVIEVLSPSTAGGDRVTNNGECAGLPSVRRYVMLEQDRAAATVFNRDVPGGPWTGRLLTGPGAALALPEIGSEALPLAELCEGLDLPGDDGDAEAAAA